MRGALLLAGLVSAFAAYGWHLGAVMVPDFSLYTQGGLGLFPSPVGRLLGALGPDAFAVLSIGGAGLVVLSAAALARARGGDPGVAAACVLPGALWLGYAGIDPIALALLGFGLFLAKPALVGLAAGAHLSLVPFAVLELGRRSTWPARYALAFVGLCAAFALALTPYQAILWLWLDWQALPIAGAALLAGLALSLPGLLLTRPTGLWLFALAVGVVESAAQVHVQARYLLPAVMLAGVGVPRGWPLQAAGLTSRLFFSLPVTDRLKGSVQAARSPENVRPCPQTDAMSKMTKGPLLTGPSKNTPTRLTRADARYRL